MKKFLGVIVAMMLMFGVGSNVTEASTKAGVSVNTTKVQYSNPDKFVAIAVKNHNGHMVGVDIQPQRKVNGKWVNLDWYDAEFIYSGEKVYTKTALRDFVKTGTYRFHVSVITFDKKGFEKSRKTINTNKFTIKAKYKRL